MDTYPHALDATILFVPDHKPTPSPRTQRLLERIVREVLPALRGEDGLSHVAATGSRAVGFTDDADLDLIVVWEGLPPSDRRLLMDRIADTAPAPTAFDQPGFCLDRFWLGGEQVDITHRTRADLDTWAQQVIAGEGWRRGAYPSPIVALSGLVYGVPMFGTWAQRGRVTAATGAVRAATVLALTDGAYDEELGKAALRSEAWLFHELLLELIHVALVCWFAGNGHLYPFAKWLPAWADHLGMDCGVAQAEQAIWTTSGLELRHERAREFVQLVLDDIGHTPASV